jgi:hypothetical protein
MAKNSQPTDGKGKTRGNRLGRRLARSIGGRMPTLGQPRATRQRLLLGDWHLWTLQTRWPVGIAPEAVDVHALLK